MDDYITRNEHKEFCQRVDAENNRQNKRIDELEQSIKQIGAIAINVEKLAVNMENMTNELKKQGDRLDDIESKPGKKWDNLSWLLVSSLVTGIIGYALALILH